MSNETEKSVAAAGKTVEQPSLLEEIVQATKIKPTDEAYAITKRGVEALIAQLLEPGKEAVKVSKAALDEMLAEVDKKLSLQVDAVLHHPDFHKMESTWRSLKFLVDRTDFRENIKIEVFNVNKG